MILLMSLQLTRWCGVPVLFLETVVYHWHYFWHSLHLTLLFLYRLFSFVAIMASSVVMLPSFFLVYNWQSCFTNLLSIFSVVFSLKFFVFHCIFVRFPKWAYSISWPCQIEFHICDFWHVRPMRIFSLFGILRLVYVLLTVFWLFFLFVRCMNGHMHMICS